MYKSYTSSTIKKMTVNQLRDFIFDSNYKGIGFVKESSFYSRKCLKKRFVITFS